MALKEYILKEGPPAIEFTHHSYGALNQLRRLIDAASDENTVQEFLEEHPFLVPGAEAPGGGNCYSRVHSLLITQPRLTGLEGRQPDFLWFSSDSARWYPTLVEIERPGKKIFRRDGVPRAEFTQAKDQVAEWRLWFDDDANCQVFKRDYGVPPEWTSRRRMCLRTILIYGRREEFRDTPFLSRKRSFLMSNRNDELMSYDRLLPNPILDSAITVRATGGGRYKALVVPCTFAIYPGDVERLLFIDGLEEAIDSSAGWSEERRSFIKDRLPYWRKYASGEGAGWIRGGDRE